MARPKTAVLTPRIVVEAAIDLIGADGLESFSMARLAKRLGVRAPSLYHHFADRDALLAEVARAVATPAAPPAAPSPEQHWTDYLIAQAVALRRTISAHPQCAPLLVRFMPSGAMFVEYDQLCRFLAASGVPSHLHVSIVDGLTALTIGAALLRENAADYTESGDGPSPDRAGAAALCEALDSLGVVTPDEQFEYYVRTYLRGVFVAD